MGSTAARDALLRQLPSGLVLPLPSPLLASLPAEYQDKPMQWFTMPITILALAAETTAAGAFNVDNKHAFASWFGNVKLRSNTDLLNRDGDPLFVAMSDNQNNNYTPANATVDVENLFGSAKQPAIWPEPLIIAPNGTFTITATNPAGGNTLNIRFAFVGVLITL